jgi:hypothetical protein
MFMLLMHMLYYHHNDFIWAIDDIYPKDLIKCTIFSRADIDAILMIVIFNYQKLQTRSELEMFLTWINDNKSIKEKYFFFSCYFSE